MQELSIFVDEAGQQDMSSGYYLLTVVVHDQSEPIGGHIDEYERQLRVGNLPDIPFHMVCLLHGQGDYKGLDLHARKSLLSRFNAFVRRLPITYHTFSYSSYDVQGSKDLSVLRMSQSRRSSLWMKAPLFESGKRRNGMGLLRAPCRR